MVPAAGAEPAGDRGQGVEGDGHRAVADRVEVQLEPEVGEQADGLGELLRIDEQVSRPVRVMPVAVQVGGAHRGREGLADAVEHELDRGGAEVAAAIGRLPARLQRVAL
jgi:hypothetical protein